LRMDGLRHLFRNMPRKVSRQNGAFARRLRRDSTRGEKLLWWALRNRRFGFKFRRQHPVGRYILDFFCAEKRLCVEIDGSTHDTPAAQAYDEARTDYLQAQRIRLIRFTESEVVDHLQAVVDAIGDELKS